MANQTVATLVKKALQSLGVLDRSETLSADDANDGLLALNDLLYRWSSERYGIYVPTKEDLTLTAGKYEYTIGSGGDFDTVRPMRILEPCYARLNNIDYKVRLISSEEYGNLGYKTQPQGIPRKLYYEPSYPLGKIFLFLVPDSAYTLHIESQKPLAQFSATTSTVDLPPEYQDAIKWNLAVDMAPMYNVDPSQIVIARADEGLRIMKKLHAQPVPRICTDAVGTGIGKEYEIEGDIYI